LKLDVPFIDVEAKANLTLFDPSHEWILNDETNLSKSKNSPWWEKKITGKAIAVFNNNRHWIDN
jgi:dihydroorotase